MSITKWLLSGCLACATASVASEGDFLIELGPQAVGRTINGYQFPMMGANISVLSGFNDQTDIGVSVSCDYAKGKTSAITGLTPSSQTWTTVAIQSWYTAFSGDIRPQIGGSMGITMDGDGNGMFQLAARARGLMEVSTRFRLYAGGALGADIGDEGSTFAKGEFGVQLLIP